MGKYRKKGVGGLFVVVNTETKRPICEPVKEGLVLDILRVANSGKVNITDRAGEGDVVVRMVEDEDLYRVISKTRLKEIVAMADRNGGPGQVQAAGLLFGESEPFPVANEDAADYSVVTDDIDSWEELRKLLKDEESGE